MPDKKKAVVPRLRFPEFRDAEPWEVKRLYQLADKKNDRNKSGAITKVLTNSAEYGVIDQRDFFDKDIAQQGALENYFLVNNGDFVYNPRISNLAPVGPISINKLGLGAMSPLYTVFRFKRGINEFYAYFFESSAWHSYLLKVSNTGARHDRMAISTGDFMAMPVPDPSIEEQQKIADCLSSLDDLIEAEEAQLTALREHKKGLLQQLFPREGETTPRLRFPEFRDAGPWEVKRLGEVLTEHKLKSSGREEVFSVSIHKGLINQIEHLGRSFAAASTAHYNRVLPGDIVYTKSPTGDFPFGIVKQNKTGRSVIVSPLYGVFSPVNFALGVLIDAFFESPQRTKAFLEPLVQKGAKNTINIKNDRFLSGTMVLPSIEGEQQKVADCLSSLDKLIELQAQRLDALKAHKKGLLQQLFPQEAA